MDLNAIVEQLQEERNRIDAAIQALKGIGSNKQPQSGTASTKPKRRVSKAARRKMAAAQKARWAKVKAAKK